MKKAVIIALISLLFVPDLFSQQIYLTHTGVISFVSNAPLEVIKAASGEVDGAINLANNTFAFSVDNKSFKGFNSPLQQEHFYENYMEVKKYPFSTFQGKIIEPIDPDSVEEQIVRAKGVLQIHGVEQERIIKGIVKFDGDRIHVHADFSVMLADHHIKIPRVVYQKIAEEIAVTINAELKLKND